MRYAIATIYVFVSVAVAQAQQRVGGIEGPWIITDILADKNLGHGGNLSDRTFVTALDCGFELKVYPAEQFYGIDKDLTVVGIGPYTRDASAASDLKAIRKCVPKAYIRRLLHFGE